MTSTLPDRLPPLDPDEMTDAQRRAAEEFVRARGGPVFGPFVPLLRSPELMTRVRALGDYLRFEGALPAPLRELVILMTAREWSQPFEWAVHYQAATAAGLSAAVADAIAEGRRPDRLSDDEAALWAFCSELARNRSVSDPTYDAVRQRFGDQAVIETVGLTGYYTLLAMVLNTARTPAAGASPPLPPLPR